jgi:hypothetical protein
MNKLRYIRELPVTEHVDVLVAGGGIAGSSAAIASARQGARTMLVEQYAVLGGTATTCGVGSFCGETTGQGEVFDDIIDGLERLGAIAAYQPYEDMEARPFDHQVLPLVLQELALGAGVELLLHAQLVDVEYTDNAIQQVVIHGKSGLEAIDAKFVIDCTGEADVAKAAGLPTIKGRDVDEAQLPLGLMFFVRDVGHEVLAPLPPGCSKLEDEDLPMLGTFPEEGGPVADTCGKSDAAITKRQRREAPGGILPKLAVKTKVAGYDPTDTRQLSAAECFARRRMFAIVHYLQGTAFPTYKLDHAAAQIGIREGRRIRGEYVLTEEDVRKGRRFQDGIARGRFYLDAMDPNTDKKVYMPDSQGEIKFQPPPYHVPLRSLIPAGSKNILAAGRCFSSDQMALSSARVMTTASMMGQAAGIAAALGVDRDADAAGIDVEQLRALLTDKGADLG